MAWVKNMDQLTKNTFQRSGVYSYNIVIMVIMAVQKELI